MSAELQPSLGETLDNLTSQVEAVSIAGEDINVENFLGRVYEVETAGFGNHSKIQPFLLRMGEVLGDDIEQGVKNLLHQFHRPREIYDSRVVGQIKALRMLGLYDRPKIQEVVAKLEAWNGSESPAVSDITVVPPAPVSKTPNLGNESEAPAVDQDKPIIRADVTQNVGQTVQSEEEQEIPPERVERIKQRLAMTGELVRMFNDHGEDEILGNEDLRSRVDELVPRVVASIAQESIFSALDYFEGLYPKIRMREYGVLAQVLPPEIFKVFSTMYKLGLEFGSINKKNKPINEWVESLPRVKPTSPDVAQVETGVVVVPDTADINVDLPAPAGADISVLPPGDQVVQDEAAKPAFPDKVVPVAQPVAPKIEAGSTTGSREAIPETRHMLMAISEISFSKALEISTNLRRVPGVRAVRAIRYEREELVFLVDANSALDIKEAIGSFDPETMKATEQMDIKDLSEDQRADVLKYAPELSTEQK